MSARCGSRGWTGPWPDDDPDANFKRDVVLYADSDPLSTLRTLSDAIDVPLGALVPLRAREVGDGRERWPARARSDDDAIGSPRCATTPKPPTPTPRASPRTPQLRDMIGWLRYPIDHPEVYE